MIETVEDMVDVFSKGAAKMQERIEELEQENERLEGNLSEVLANERLLIKQLSCERKSRSNRLYGAAQRYVEVRALLDCSRFYAKSHQGEEYANAERIALEELKAALEEQENG